MDQGLALDSLIGAVRELLDRTLKAEAEVARMKVENSRLQGELDRRDQLRPGYYICDSCNREFPSDQFEFVPYERLDRPGEMVERMRPNQDAEGAES